MSALAEFKNRAYFPPGGSFFYTVEATGRYFESRVSMADLLQQVHAHLAVNKLPHPATPAELRPEVENHMCQRLTKGFCTDPDVGVPGLDIFSIEKATTLLFHRTTKPDFFVSALEADRRAAICKDCTFNLRHICTSCTGLKEVFGRLIGKRKTRYHDQLGICAKCGCGLQAKVQVDRKYLDSDPAFEEGLPQFCWLKKGPTAQ